MNSKYRKPATLLCLALLFSPAMAAAEKTETTPAPVATVEPMPEAVDAPIELPVIEAVYEEVPPIAAEAITEASDSDVILPELTIAPAAEIEFPASGVASGSNYENGYAKLTSAAMGYSSASPNADGIIYLEDGVFYVSDRRSSAPNDRLRVHFDDGGETKSVWVDESHLRAMSGEEVHDFIASIDGQSTARHYSGDPHLPLDEATYSSVVTYSPGIEETKQDTPAMFVNRVLLTLNPGETAPIGVSFSDGNGYAVHFSSEDATVASVSEDGRVTGVCTGSTSVRLKSEFGNTAVVEIQVQD